MVRRNEKVAYAVARAIINDVVAANLPPGSLLEGEAAMQERYGVSRGSLRESLRILELLGFVQMKPGPRGGPVVTPVESQQFGEVISLYYQRMDATYRDLLETRLTLEPAAAELAALRRTKAQVAGLERYIEDARQADLSDDADFRFVGQKFHDLVASMAGNRIITLLIRSHYDVFSLRSGGYLYPERARKGVRDCHEEIAAALIEGDGVAARRLMQEHMKDYLAQATKRYAGLMAEIVRW
jgi:GntR family transcriptional repressor for pyruvate dehydrogenase complex